MRVADPFRLLAVAALSGWLAAGAAAEPTKPHGILPASILSTKAIELSAANPVPRRSWHGLVCSGDGCELRPVALRFTPQPEQDSIRITYAPTSKKKTRDEFTVALVSGGSVTGRKAVPTWFTVRTPRIAEDSVNGSMGTTIRTPKDGDYHLVPRWNPDSPEEILVYLEHRQKRQLIGRMDIKALDNGLKPSDFALWAGDLDGDKKIDLIARVGGNIASGGLHLWLSTLADEGNLVGIASSLDNWLDVEEAEGC